MAAPKKRLEDRIDDAPGFVGRESMEFDPVTKTFAVTNEDSRKVSDDVGTPLNPVTWFDRHPKKSDPRKPTSNEKTFEGSDAVVPVLVAAVVDILTVGAIAPHRSAIRRHLSDRALDQAIQKLQSIRRD